VASQATIDSTSNWSRWADGEEHDGEAGELAGRGAVDGGVDDSADDERAGDRERRGAGHERAEAGPTTRRRAAAARRVRANEILTA
jgi:hypothetical protein